jgi:hypothetical protein
MNTSRTASNPIRNLQIMAIVAASILIVAMLSLSYLTHGMDGMLADSSHLGFALAFWTASGILAGLILGKMDAVVEIGNAERWTNASALDHLIVTLSCSPMVNGRVLQLQIANLLSAPVAVGIVYVTCLALSAVTGVKMLAEYPGYTLMVIPLVIAWKIVENATRRRLVRRHFEAHPLAA